METTPARTVTVLLPGIFPFLSGPNGRVGLPAPNLARRTLNISQVLAKGLGSVWGTWTRPIPAAKS